MRNNEEKLVKLANHIADNPADYQSRIAFYKLRSKEIEHRQEQRQIERIKLIKKCKEQLENEERTI